jgi:hypothetical protein
MSVNDPVLDDLRDMFAWFEGPATPRPRARRPRAPRRLILVGAIALVLAAASVASADGLGLFDGGTPVSPQVQAQIAASSQGAPPALDPGIEAGTAVTLITIPTEQGTASLVVSRATRASYCDGIAFSWLGDRQGLGCDGPVESGTVPPAIDFGQAVLGILGRSPRFVWGHVQPAQASTVRLDLTDGTQRDIPLTDGFYLTELGAHDQVDRVEALDPSGAVLAAQSESPVGIGIPTTTP